MDLSYVAAYKLGIIGAAGGVESIGADEIRRLASQGPAVRRPSRRRPRAQPVAEPVAAAPVALTPVALPAPQQARPTPAGGIGNLSAVGAFSQPANAQTLVSRINAGRGRRRPP